MQGFLEVPDTPFQLPFTVITGNQPGKTVLITAGIHGSEYVGIETSKKLGKIIQPALVHGKIILLHLVNTSAFRERLAAIMAEDGENLNRMFPGNREGKPSERLAYFLLNQLFRHSDFYIDLHGADLYETIHPLVFYPTVTTGTVLEASRKAAEASGFPYLVASRAKSGAYNSTAALGIPSILTELGGLGLWSEGEVSTYTENILRVLTHLGVYPGDFPVAEPVTYFDPVNELEASVEGFWYPSFQTGASVTKGEVVGEIRDVFNNVLETCYSPVSGVILYQTVSLSVKAGGFLAAIASVGEPFHG